MTQSTSIRIGEWRADRLSGRLSGPTGEVAVEPKVMDLLFLLAERPGEVIPREILFERLWPGVVVGEDTLARCVSKLRRALGDAPKTPRYIETISKRGYRLLAPEAAPVAVSKPKPRWIVLAVVAAVLFAVVGVGVVWRGQAARTAESARLTGLADDFYFQYTRADNEAAIALYERVIAADPRYAPAQAGLANALVQRVVRWPEGPERPEIGRTDLRQALASGRTRTPQARRILTRALELAEGAVRLEPDDAGVQRALGFVRSAGGDFAGATEAYRRAVALDPDAWGALINLGDVADIQGRDAEALADFERAYDAMTRVADREPTRVRPWRAELGVVIADRHARAGRGQQAELWYRRVLAYAPLHRTATAGLAAVLARSGDAAGARRLCVALVERTGPEPGCAPYL
ncbi:winged helix-turn-helix domain-containing protein [Caulobacter mirabilis]|uniref:OmpR/PhoB-type domain-containing protein n=1 Tax=Caulobacter mirabilis TaxID=69666 RepID=A0A2D2AU59_9CAUL|nr:transcriptional regulator [Caulobacter mirabilis]ATQ41548.1 hypothetical protein CSW64_03530 [Caulobacter mirabilis]